MSHGDACAAGGGASIGQPCVLLTRAAAVPRMLLQGGFVNATKPAEIASAGSALSHNGAGSGTSGGGQPAATDASAASGDPAGASDSSPQPSAADVLLRNERAAEGAARQLTAVLERHVKRVNGAGPSAPPATPGFAVAMVPFSPEVPPRAPGPASSARGHGLRVHAPASPAAPHRRSPRNGPASARSTASTVATPLGSPLGSPFAAAAAADSPASSSRRRNGRNPRSRRRRAAKAARARAPKTPKGRVYNPRLEFCAIIRTFGEATRGADVGGTGTKRGQAGASTTAPTSQVEGPTKRPRLEPPTGTVDSDKQAGDQTTSCSPSQRPSSPTVVLLGVTPAELDFTCDHSEFLEFPG